MGEILKVSGLCKASILNEVDFSMREKEMVAIMGPSGSGKSTLLYQLAGMDQADKGEIWFDGMNIFGLSEDEKASIRLHQMGFVFQQMNMMANLNILDNILMPALQAHKKVGKIKHEGSTQRLKEKAICLMKQLGIKGLEKRSITEVSGGQLQRACICRAVINNPKILFADEPTGALNQGASKEVMQEFIKLNQRGMSILMVTHDSKVASICDRVLYLVDGKVTGELILGKYDTNDSKLREKKMQAWLEEKKW